MRGARRLWLLLALVGVLAVVVANVALLGLAAERDDPVGRLQPVTTLDVGGQAGTPPPTAPGAPTTTGPDDGDDHGGSSGGDDRDD